jgi:hypothetical protein
MKTSGFHVRCAPAITFLRLGSLCIHGLPAAAASTREAFADPPRLDDNGRELVDLSRQQRRALPIRRRAAPGVTVTA